MILQASQGEQPVQSDVVLVNRMDWPPLLINPSAPLVPCQQAHDIPKPLNKPNTPTGDISVLGKPAWDSSHCMLRPGFPQRLSMSVASNGLSSGKQ